MPFKKWAAVSVTLKETREARLSDCTVLLTYVMRIDGNIQSGRPRMLVSKTVRTIELLGPLVGIPSFLVTAHAAYLIRGLCSDYNARCPHKHLPLSLCHSIRYGALALLCSSGPSRLFRSSGAPLSKSLTTPKSRLTGVSIFSP